MHTQRRLPCHQCQNQLCQSPLSSCHARKPSCDHVKQEKGVVTAAETLSHLNHHSAAWRCAARAAARVRVAPSQTAVKQSRQCLAAQCCAQTANVAAADWFSWTAASPVVARPRAPVTAQHCLLQHWKGVWQADPCLGPAPGCVHQQACVSQLMYSVLQCYYATRQMTTKSPWLHEEPDHYN